ncbi:hypothetical protein AAFC00_000319 [Neodothiora populina]|uniref:amidase n=1 Tax=Neodothiora populina TaxID=2781224 RepID=A0ABR3PD30_9PEZI
MPLIATQTSWEDVAAAAQKHRDSTIAAVKPPVPDVPSDLPLNVTKLPATLLSSEEVSITESPPEVLVASLCRGTLSAVAVANAFLRRAGLAQKLTNCITELLPERALERAEFLDDYMAKNGKPIGPLHGLPISVKEHIGMAGLSLNAGFVSWADRVASADAHILSLLWNAGAVFYARTTEPQTLMHLECSSGLFGVTVNPYNRNLTSGGSSGGEGAILGMRASCMGIGTDIGGSIRSPAANNGVFGLRPTTYRLPMGGFSSSMPGQEHIVAVVGPLTTSLEGVKMFMKTLIDQKPWLTEPSLVPFPWRDTSSESLLRVKDGKRKLKIGIMKDDGVVRPHPPILRAINKIVSDLSSHSDIEIVQFPPYKCDDAWRIISSLYFADGGNAEASAIEASGEPWRPMSEFIIKQNKNLKTLTIPELWKLTSERNEYRAAFTNHWNSVSGSLEDDDLVDVVLCPTGPGVAPVLETARYWNYTSLWNLLDYPALVFPTGLACTPELDTKEGGYTPRNQSDEYNQTIYTPEAYRDAPISLQLVGRRYEDERVIEAMEMIANAASLPLKV